jgi:hypothetical protein
MRGGTATWVLGGLVVILLAVVGWLASEVSSTSTELAEVRAELAAAEASALATPPRRAARRDAPMATGRPPDDVASDAVDNPVGPRFDPVRVGDAVEDFINERALSEEDAAAVRDEVGSYARLAAEVRSGIAAGEVDPVEGRRQIREARRGMESALAERLGTEDVMALRGVFAPR